MTQFSFCENCPSDMGFPGSGNSEESSLLRKYYTEELRTDSKTAAAGRYKRIANLIELLVDIYSDCNQTGWDGYNAQPITESALIDAIRLYSLLPKDIIQPEVTPEPDGSIGFEWYTNAWRTLSMSVNGDNIIVFSGLFGGNDTDHGHKPLADKLDPSLVSMIDRLS